MRVASVLTLFTVSAVVSAVQLRNAYTGLCLDAPDGLRPYAKLIMVGRNHILVLKDAGCNLYSILTILRIVARVSPPCKWRLVSL